MQADQQTNFLDCCIDVTDVVSQGTTKLTTRIRFVGQIAVRPNRWKSTVASMYRCCGEILQCGSSSTLAESPMIPMCRGGNEHGYRCARDEIPMFEGDQYRCWREDCTDVAGRFLAGLLNEFNHLPGGKAYTKLCS